MVIKCSVNQTVLPTLVIIIIIVIIIMIIVRFISDKSPQFTYNITK